MKIPAMTNDPDKNKREAEILKNYQARLRIEQAGPLLLAALKGLGLFMPSKDAPCHSNICDQSQCGHCSRIAAALKAIAAAEGK